MQYVRYYLDQAATYEAEAAKLSKKVLRARCLELATCFREMADMATEVQLIQAELDAEGAGKH